MPKSNVYPLLGIVNKITIVSLCIGLLKTKLQIIR